MKYQCLKSYFFVLFSIIIYVLNYIFFNNNKERFELLKNQLKNTANYERIQRKNLIIYYMIVDFVFKLV